MAESKSNLEAQLLKLIISDTNNERTLDASLKDSLKALKDTAKDNIALKDAYGNSLAATGTDDKAQSFTKYMYSNDTLNWWLWTALYSDSWVFKRCIDKPAEDMIDAGIEIHSNDKNIEKVINDIASHRSDFINLLKWGYLYGGSVAVMLLDNIVDDSEYAKPMNVNRLQACKTIRLYVTDRWYGISAHGNETVTDMSSEDFGYPVRYDLTFANGKSIVVHHDYVLRYKHRIAPKLIETGQLQGWGYSEGSHLLNELARDDKIKADITSLMNKSLIEVIKMAGMRGVFMGADEDGEQQLRKRLEMVNWGRTFNSLTFLDKDDEYQEHSFSGLSGLSDMLEKQMVLVAGAAEMPGLLFGDLKNGIGTDSQAMDRWEQVIHSRDETFLRPVYKKFLQIEFLRFDIKEIPSFDFRYMQEKKHNDERMTSMNTCIDILSKLLADGILTTRKYAESLAAYLKTGSLDIDFTDKELYDLNDRTQEEFENINIDK